MGLCNGGSVPTTLVTPISLRQAKPYRPFCVQVMLSSNVLMLKRRCPAQSQDRSGCVRGVERTGMFLAVEAYEVGHLLRED
jgi:hypothetical protein